MATIDEEMLEHLIDLSRISYPEEKKEKLLSDMRKIVDYVEQLQEVDTEGVKPCNQVIQGMNNVFREDEVGETLERKTFLDNSPKQVGGMISVPQVMSNS